MIAVHVIGASGYAAAEAIRLLRAHPRVELGVLESASHAGEPVGRHFPLLRALERTFSPSGSVLESLLRNDAVVLAGTHGTARKLAPLLLERGARVIDLSADFRMDRNVAAYGLTHRYRDAIAGATLVANPGCYPTAVLLATLPLAELGAIEHIVVDAKSGLTGAGRVPAVDALFAEVAGGVRAYGLDGHRHEAEIVHQWEAAGIGATLTFTPHTVPLARGMLADTYAWFARAPRAEAVHAAFERAYGSDPFVRVLEASCAPSIPAVAGTNDAELHVTVAGRMVRAICAIDNLGRGAAGQAVANLNVMYGLPVEMGFHGANALAC